LKRIGKASFLEETDWLPNFDKKFYDDKTGFQPLNLNEKKKPYWMIFKLNFWQKWSKKKALKNDF
jgi:hypothetical protein